MPKMQSGCKIFTPALHWQLKTLQYSDTNESQQGSGSWVSNYIYCIQYKDKKKIKEKEHLPTSPCKSKMFTFETQVKMNKNKKGSINTQA